MDARTPDTGMNALKSETRLGMRIDWDVPIEMDDGIVLRADLFRPAEGGPFPVIMSQGPYCKALHFDDYFSEQWRRMIREHPDVAANSTNAFANFEQCDPEKFCPEGYAILRIDSRGAGRSPGHMDLWSRREAEDLYACIEWAAAQDWCDGKVGLNGISYLAMNQWQVAEMQPPHLTCMCVWEGAYDYYRDMCYHGGIACTFGLTLWHMAILPFQHGLGERGLWSRMNGEWVSGPETLSDIELAATRSNWHEDLVANPLATAEFWTSRLPDPKKIKTPVLSSANWGGVGLHPRGNFEGFTECASEEKWLEVHGLEHWTHFYTDYGVDLQKRFFGHFLKGEDTGWKDQPKVQLQIRHPGEKFIERHEDEWPLARTKWTKLHLDPEMMLLSQEAQKKDTSLSYRSLSEGATFLTLPMEEDTEITGPLAAKLFLSSSTEDADVFLVFRVFTPDFKEVTFQGSNDPHTPVGLGWLRASHRKLDKKLSKPYRPYHSHDEPQKLKAGEVCELDIEIVPTCIVVPRGYRIGLTVRGKDYEWPGGSAATKGIPGQGTFTGVAAFRHNEARDRPPAIYDNEVTLHFGPERQAHLLLPVIPSK